MILGELNFYFDTLFLFFSSRKRFVLTHLPKKVHFSLKCSFLFQVSEASAAGSSSGEALSRRCFKLLKTALQPDCWPCKELGASQTIKDC